MQTIYLDISNKGVIPCIQAKQSDVGRKFLAVITDNGVPYNIPTDSLLSVWYEGDTDAGNYSSIKEKSAFGIAGNKVTVELVAQMLLKPGTGEMCLSITHGDGGETNTWNIPYCVEYKPGAGSAVPTEYYTALTEAGSQAAKWATEAKTAAEEAKYAVNGYVEKKNLFDLIYPIGSVYISLSEINPGNIFGGRWNKIQGSFLLASSDSHGLGQTGGAERHTLTISEMPTHSHHFTEIVYGYDGWSGTSPSGELKHNYNANHSTKALDTGVSFYARDTRTSGDGVPFDIMPPYLVVNIWTRVE